MPDDEKEFEEIEIEGKPVAVTSTSKYKRYNIRPLKRFRPTSMRTLDIGKPRGHQLIRGRLWKNNKWKTQAVIAYRGTPKMATKEIVKKAVKYQ